MPTYEYYCKTCEIKFDVKQSFDSKPVAKCIEKDCDEECQRQFSVVPVVFKGSGWYVTDYAKKSSTSNVQTKETDKDSKNSDKSSTKESTKAEKTSSNKTDSKKDTITSKNKSDKKYGQEL